MGRVVINTCYGGFDLSEEACNWLKEKDFEIPYPYYDAPRHHPLLIQCVEELRDKASGFLAELIIKEFEGDIYRICEYDGLEWVETPNDIDWVNVNNTSAS